MYDDSSIPIPQFMYDESLFPSKEDPGKYDLYLTTKPSFNPHLNEIDVSSCPKGLAIVRIIYPKDEETVERCMPTVEEVPYGKRN